MVTHSASVMTTTTTTMRQSRKSARVCVCRTLRHMASQSIRTHTHIRAHASSIAMQHTQTTYDHSNTYPPSEAATSASCRSAPVRTFTSAESECWSICSSAFESTPPALAWPLEAIPSSSRRMARWPSQAISSTPLLRPSFTALQPPSSCTTKEFVRTTTIVFTPPCFTAAAEHPLKRRRRRTSGGGGGVTEEKKTEDDAASGR